MTQDEIIQMAIEAGLGEYLHLDGWRFTPDGEDIKSLERFFNLAFNAGSTHERNRIFDESKHIIKRAEVRGAIFEREKQAEQSPVAIKQLPDPYDERDGVWFDAEGLQRLRELPVGTKLYATPVRTKDLTDDEIAAALKLDLDLVTEVEFRDARAVITKFKEKNK